MRFPVKKAMVVLGGVLALCGCAATQGASDSAGAGKGMLDSTKGQIDAARDQVKGEKDKAKADEEAKKKLESGEADEDGTRLKAKEAPINTPIDDSIDFKKFDKNDWRKFQLAGKPGILTVELHWDDEKSNIDVDVYDTDGVNVGKSPPKLEGQQHKRVLVQVDQPGGMYYVRVSAPTDKDASIYTLRVKWKGTVVMAVVVPPPPPPPPPGGTPPPPPPPGGTPPPPPVVLPFAQDPTKVLGRVVTAYKEGSQWTLLLDRGSAQKIHAGMSGSVLDGAEGDKLLDGATFSISNVIDASKSEAHAALAKPLGKNSRVVINLK